MDGEKSANLPESKQPTILPLRHMSVFSASGRFSVDLRHITLLVHPIWIALFIPPLHVASDRVPSTERVWRVPIRNNVLFHIHRLPADLVNHIKAMPVPVLLTMMPRRANGSEH